MDSLDGYVGKASLKMGAVVGMNQKLGQDSIEEGEGGLVEEYGGLMEVEEEGGGSGEGEGEGVRGS